MYQIVTPDPSVGTVTVSCMARDAEGCQPSTGTVRVGVDPTAGTDVNAPAVEWGTPVELNGTHQQVSSPTVSVNSPYTIFIQWDIAIDPVGLWGFVSLDSVQVVEGAAGTPTEPPSGVRHWRVQR
jgi:hypothetical protein